MRFKKSTLLALLYISTSTQAAKMPRTKLSHLQSRFNSLIKQNKPENSTDLCQILNEIADNEIYNEVVEKQLVSTWVKNKLSELQQKFKDADCVKKLQDKLGLSLPSQLPEASRKPSESLAPTAPGATSPEIVNPSGPVVPSVSRQEVAQPSLPTQSTVPSAPPLPQPPLPVEPVPSEPSLIQPEEKRKVDEAAQATPVAEEAPLQEPSLQELIKYLATMAEESTDIAKLAEKYGLTNPDGTANTKALLELLSTNEQQIKKKAASVSSQQANETESTIDPYLKTIRANVEQYEIEHGKIPALTNNLQDQLQALSRMVKESYDVPAMAEKYGLVQNGIVNTDPLLQELITTEKFILDQAAQESAAKRAETEKIITPQLDTIRTNITNYQQSQIPEAPALIPEAPPFEPKPQQPKIEKPKQPEKPQRREGPKPEELQEAAKKLKPLEEREKAGLINLKTIKKPEDLQTVADVNAEIAKLNDLMPRLQGQDKMNGEIALKGFERRKKELSGIKPKLPAKIKENIQDLINQIEQQKMDPIALPEEIQDKIIEIYISKADGPLYLLPDQNKKILEKLLSAKAKRVKGGALNQITNQLAQLRFKGPEAEAQVQEHLESWATN